MPTIVLQVAVGGDDGTAIFNTSAYSAVGSTLPCGDQDEIGTNIVDSNMRFTGVNIDQGENITDAFITFIPVASQSGSPVTRFRGDDQDNAPAVTSFVDFTGRSRTGADVSYTPPAWVAPTPENSPDISSVIQEIIARPGWNSGNALNIFWETVGPNSAVTADFRQADSFNGAPANAPTLTITFGGPVGRRRLATGIGMGLIIRNDTG